MHTKPWPDCSLLIYSSRTSHPPFPKRLIHLKTALLTSYSCFEGNTLVCLQRYLSHTNKCISTLSILNKLLLLYVQCILLNSASLIARIYTIRTEKHSPRAIQQNNPQNTKVYYLSLEFNLFLPLHLRVCFIFYCSTSIFIGMNFKMFKKNEHYP